MEEKKSLADLRMLTGMSRKAFAEYFGIPYRTLENWENGARAVPAYIVSLIEYKLEHENMLLPGWAQDNRDQRGE